MLGDFDIDTAAQGILHAGRLVEMGELAPGSPAFDAGDSNGLVLGDVHEGCTVRGSQALVIEGSLLGTGLRPCTVQAEGDVVIRADVQYAQITGRSIRIGGEARYCRFSAIDGVEIGADLSEARVVAGVFETRKHQLEILQQRTLQAGRERALCEQRLRAEERRIDKLFKSTRFTCENTLSQIIRPRSDRIQINLRPFYQAVGQRPEDELDQALLQFYARAVIGRLALENKVHLKDNPSRQKAFIRVLQKFRGLFELTRRFDRYSTQIEGYTRDISATIESLCHQVPALHVRGTVIPELELSFMLPELERAEDGRVTLVAHAARLHLTAGVEPGNVQVKQVTRNGEETVQSVLADELCGTVIRVNEGQIECPKVRSLVEAC
jgi:hypothetical protein